MTNAELTRIVAAYRERPLIGVCCDLTPLSEQYFPAVVALRNRPETAQFLNQRAPLTIEMQRDWYERHYLPARNDLYWIVTKKDGAPIGTIRLNEITPRSCAQSSFIISADDSTEAPYTAETEYLTLRFCFDTLGVETVINEPRTDNRAMNRLAKKMGFLPERVIEKESGSVNYCTLTRDRFPRAMLEDLLAYWAQR